MTVLAICVLSALAGSALTVACGVGVVYFANREEQQDLALEQKRNRGISPVRYVAAKAEGKLTALPGGLQENL